MNIEPLKDQTAARVAALTQGTSPRALIDLHVEEAFFYVEERLGVDWDEVPDLTEKQADKVAVIVSSSMASIINETGGLSRATSMSESALGYSQSVSLANHVSRWVSGVDISRIARVLELTPEDEKSDYPVFVTIGYKRTCLHYDCWGCLSCR